MPTTPLRRRAGRLLLTGAALTFAGCVLVAVVQSSATMSDDLFNYPFASGPGFTAWSLYDALSQLLLTLGLVVYRRAGGPRGLVVAAVGMGVLSACEIVSIGYFGWTTDDAWLVLGFFAIASVLIAGGMLWAGVSAARDHRYAPLACAVLTLAVLPLQATEVLWAGVAAFALGFAVLGAALTAERRPALATA